MTTVPQFLLGRRAALAGLCVALAVLVLLIVLPVMAIYASQQQEKNDSLYQLAIFRAEAAMKPQLEAELLSLHQRGVSTPGLISADSVTLAQAQMERDIKGIVETNGGEIHSAQNGTSSRIGDLDLILIQYDLSIPVMRLSALTYAVESHTPYFFIDRADIAAPAGWQVGANAPAAPKLEIHWTIRGYRWGAK